MLQFSEFIQDSVDDGENLDKGASGASSRDAPKIYTVADMALAGVSYPLPYSHPLAFLFDNVVIYIGLHLQFIHLCCCNLCAYQKQTSEMEGETHSVTCEPNKEATRSPPRDVPNIDIPDPIDVVPAGVSYLLPLLTHLCPPPLVFFLIM